MGHFGDNTFCHWSFGVMRVWRIVIKYDEKSYYKTID